VGHLADEDFAIYGAGRRLVDGKFAIYGVPGRPNHICAMYCQDIFHEAPNETQSKDIHCKRKWNQSAHDSFEGVCETHVMLTPGACGRGVRAALHDTKKSGKSGPGCTFPTSVFFYNSFVNLTHFTVITINFFHPSHL